MASGARPDPAFHPDVPLGVLEAAHRLIARVPSLLAAMRLADLVGPVAPTSLPGTAESCPSWQHRCPLPIEDLERHPAFRAVTRAMAAERSRGG